MYKLNIVYLYMIYTLTIHYDTLKKLNKNHIYMRYIMSIYYDLIIEVYTNYPSPILNPHKRHQQQHKRAGILNLLRLISTSTLFLITL